MTTESITWKPAASLTDSDTAVLLFDPVASESVWLGYLNGYAWPLSMSCPRLYPFGLVFHSDQHHDQTTLDSRSQALRINQRLNCGVLPCSAVNSNLVDGRTVLVLA